MPPAPEISSETTVTDNPNEVPNEPTSIEEQPAIITGRTAIASVSTERIPEISQSPIDILTTAEPITMNLPEITSDTLSFDQTVTPTDPLDIFSAETQNNEINNNEDSQPKQTTDDLGFLDAFG